MRQADRKSAIVLAALVLTLAGRDVPARAADLKLSEWLDKVTLSGDMRLRQENFDKRSPGQVDRSRQRFRLRLATDISFPNNLEAKLRFASGTGEQVSTNQSFDNGSSQKAIWIDRAYLLYTPWTFLKLSSGRMANPFWTVYTSDAVWDDDYNPEGFAQSLEYLLPWNTRVFVNALQMVVDEDAASNEDQWMYGEQAGVDLLLPLDVRVKMAGAYYKWTHVRSGNFSQNVANEGNRGTGRAPSTTPGILSNEFGVAEFTGELSYWIAGLPLSVQGTFIRNMRAKINPMEDVGYQVGGRYGKASSARSWEAAYFYKWVETDATVADVADSDFGDGGTNRRGHILWAAFNPTEWLQVKTKYFLTKVIDESLAPGSDDIRRLQADVSVKF